MYIQFMTHGQKNIKFHGRSSCLTVFGGKCRVSKPTSPAEKFGY